MVHRVAYSLKYKIAGNATENMMRKNEKQRKKGKNR